MRDGRRDIGLAGKRYVEPDYTHRSGRQHHVRGFRRHDERHRSKERRAGEAQQRRSGISIEHRDSADARLHGKRVGQEQFIDEVDSAIGAGEPTRRRR
jgi:hypothetical protein